MRSDAEHHRATKIAAGEDCLACGYPAPSEPAHFPTHRGMGGAKAGWHPTEWVPLCRRCHDELDKRNGPGILARYSHELTLSRIGTHYEAWQQRWS